MRTFTIATLITFALITHVARGLVIPSGQVYTNFGSETFASLVVSGTLVLASTLTNGGGDDRSITITNGDFILAPGGAISQLLYVTTVTSNGVSGAAGSSEFYDGEPGGPAGGIGTGGIGGAGYSPTNISEAGDVGGNGGDGGDGGSIAGSGGQGGCGGRGADGDDITSDAGCGGIGGYGGTGGNGPRAFSLTIRTISCNGSIRLDGQVSLRAGMGGSGGNAAIAGNGGVGYVTDGYGGDGGDGGMGGDGGNGGVGGMLTLVASNGTVRLTNHEIWLSGAQGGTGGNGGDGGNGGAGDGSDSGGNAGNGGDSGNCGNGGAGGSLAIIAGGIFTNGIQVRAENSVAAHNGGAPGVPGSVGQPGVRGPGGGFGEEGLPGSAGTNGPPGTNSFTPDLIPPVCSADPVIEPADGSDLLVGIATAMVFSVTNFSDNMVCTAALRQTIDIVPTNDLAGVPLARIAADIRTIPANAATNFIPQAEWMGPALCFRFITTDAGGNATTSAFPATHHFSVIPEPAMAAGVLALLWSAATRRRIAAVPSAGRKAGKEH